MAGTRIIFPEFREEQGDSKYPFADRGSLKTLEEGLEIPRNGFIDAVIHIIGAANKAYLSRVVVSAQTVTLVIGATGSAFIAQATYDPLSIPDIGYLPLSDSYSRPAGALILTKECMAELGGWAPGVHTFSIDDTEFVSSIVIPAQEPGVRGIQSLDEINFFTDDVWLIGDSGVVVRQESEQVVRIDITGEPLFKRKLCEQTAEGYAPGPFLQTINGCGPDEYGNFNLTVVGDNTPDSILRIYPQNGQLKIGLAAAKVI